MSKTITIPDSFFYTGLWRDEKFSRGQAYLELVRLANDRTYTKEYNFAPKTFRRGCVYMSNTMLAARFRWSSTKVGVFLNELSASGHVRITGKGINREIELTDYDSFVKEHSKASEGYFVLPEVTSGDESPDDADDWFQSL